MTLDSVQQLIDTQREVNMVIDTASLRVTGTGFPFGKVGDTWTVDGERLGRIARTDYVHDTRRWRLWVLPELLYWHCKLRMQGSRIASTSLFPVHDAGAPLPRSLLLHAAFPCRPFSVAERSR